MATKKSIGENSMTVGVDGKRAVLNATGLGNYSRYYLNIMSMAYPSTKFRLYSPVDKENDRLKPLLDRANIDLFVPKLSMPLMRSWWRTIDMPLQLRNDEVSIYHGLSNELPLTIKGVCPTVVTIHDLIYRRVKADYSAIDRRLYDFKYSRSARIATRVIAISERTKADLIADYDIDPEKIDVIYQGIDPIFTLNIDTAKRMEVRQKYNLPERYILAVGTVQPRKNQLLAVKALERLPKSVKLVIVGRMSGSYANEVERYISSHGLADRVLHPDVPFSDLPALYADAAVSSYTSRYEGFGLPVVESLTVGTPVIACTGSCLEEAGGEGGIYIAPDDVDAYVEAAEHLLDDRVFYDKTVRLGKQHVRRFSADTFAKATMATYKKAIISELI